MRLRLAAPVRGSPRREPGRTRFGGFAHARAVQRSPRRGPVPLEHLMGARAGTVEHLPLEISLDHADPRHPMSMQFLPEGPAGRSWGCDRSCVSTTASMRTRFAWCRRPCGVRPCGRHGACRHDGSTGPPARRHTGASVMQPRRIARLSANEPSLLHAATASAPPHTPAKRTPHTPSKRTPHTPSKRPPAPAENAALPSESSLCRLSGEPPPAASDTPVRVPAAVGRPGRTAEPADGCTRRSREPYSASCWYAVDWKLSR